jgi:hypothetical protein
LPKAVTETKESAGFGWNEPEMEGDNHISGERFVDWALFDITSKREEVEKFSYSRLFSIYLD